MSVARAHVISLGRHLRTMISGYTIRMDVRHDEKIIDFVTESMCPEEKRLIYLPHKKMMREMYPEYMIVEKHT